jgi:hypothetical protein
MASVERRVSTTLRYIRESSPFSTVSLADSNHRSESFEAALLEEILDRRMFAHHRDTLTHLHSISTTTYELSSKVCEAAAVRASHADSYALAVDEYLIHVSRLSFPEFLEELTSFAEAAVHRLMWLSASAPTVATEIVDRLLKHKETLIAVSHPPQYPTPPKILAAHKNPAAPRGHLMPGSHADGFTRI